MWYKKYSKRNNIGRHGEIPSHSKNSGCFRLGLWLISVFVVWLVVLPLLGRWEPLQNRIAEQKVKGINPEALFYTDLEMVDSILGIENRGDRR